ncbi:hypothetical protein ACIBED_13775 [Rhodococcus coprophilus]|uniref:Lipoprotein n=1 Tax=Rhodococcus coprophilus TaxID=38310 RepID=A0A2X4UAV5_9NOCA|nr:hypothetical protein [Rhodococcus coprophilus]MBM7459426.1 hypothetical protein [Rhodococcus coprophilus]SQI36041.1 lipoprotein [Rhodococcus coprophilus]
MRVSISRRALAVCGSIAIAAAVVAGCSDSSDDTVARDTSVSSATTKADTTTTETIAEAAAADTATTEAVTASYVTFFDGTTPAATRATVVENGDAFLPALEGMAADPQASATTATVEGVTVADDGTATVSWTLLMNGAPVLPDQSGEAVEQDGTWKVSAATFCALLAIQGDGSAVPGC